MGISSEITQNKLVESGGHLFFSLSTSVCRKVNEIGKGPKKKKKEMKRDKSERIKWGF